MTLPLMPKATAVWLIEKTTLTFEQISEFCGLHPLEVQGIADGDVAPGVVGKSPIQSGQITQEELDTALANPDHKIRLKSDFNEYLVAQQKTKNRYTPVARRQDKPDAIAWIIKNHPEMNDTQIAKLIGTTKNTISSVRERTHWNIQNIRSRDPVLLGLCTQTDLGIAVKKASGVDPKLPNFTITVGATGIST